MDKAVHGLLIDRCVHVYPCVPCVMGLGLRGSAACAASSAAPLFEELQLNASQLAFVRC